MKIGVFDSGIGGLTVLRELVKALPHVDFFYFGDTANVPYGTKSPDQIRSLCFSAAKVMKRQNIDGLVIACNTASSLALDVFEKAMGKRPVMGVVEAGVQGVLLEANKRSVLVKQIPVVVFATRATVNSGVYKKYLLKAGLSRVEEVACPLLVPMIEEGFLDHPILVKTVDWYVHQSKLIQKLPSATEGILLLGCTHYPWIEPLFAKRLKKWRVVNSAKTVADQLHLLLEDEAARAMPRRKSRLEFLFSDPSGLMGVPLLAKREIQRL